LGRVKKYGDDTIKMSKHFGQRLNISLIDNFKAEKSYYRIKEKVEVKYTLQQQAYTYLISVENKDACLIYPNRRHLNNKHPKRNYNLNGFGFDTRGNVELYVVGSLEEIDFLNFHPQNIYYCTSAEKGLNKIMEMRKNNLIDIKRFDITVE
jgi:hypothetical protein